MYYVSKWVSLSTDFLHLYSSLPPLVRSKYSFYTSSEHTLIQGVYQSAQKLENAKHVP